MSDIERLLIQFENASHASEHAAYQGHIRTADIKAKRAADKRDEIIALFAAKDAEIARLKGEYAELFEGYKEKDRVFCDAVIRGDELEADLAALKAEVEAIKQSDVTGYDRFELGKKFADNALRTRAEQAEAELAAEKGKVEKVRKWLNGSIINSCPECGQEIGIIDWNALEQILRGEP